MAQFLNRLPPDVLDQVIRAGSSDKNPGAAFYQKLVELGYNPPEIYSYNPLWYHEDASNYGA